MITRIILGLVGMGVGFITLYYARRVQEIVGKWEWAEKFFPMGTETAIKLLGILIMILSFLYITGTHEIFIAKIVTGIQGSGQALTR